MLKEEFKNLQEEIATKDDGPSDEEIAMVMQYLRLCSCENWRQIVETYKPYGFCDSVSLCIQICEAKDRGIPKKKEGKKIIDLTFLAHGNVQNALLPCTLCYLNESVESITLYVPWGGALHSSAAYGILIGNISINTVNYTTDYVLPHFPFDWNTLPRDGTLFPDVVFNQVTTSENAYNSLMCLFHLPEGKTRELVIPYFKLPGGPNLPEIPLWALTNVVGVLDWLLDVRFRIHIAACMISKDKSIETRSLYSPLLTVNCKQFFVVPVQHKDPVSMFIPGFIEPEYLKSSLVCLTRYWERTNEFCNKKSVFRPWTI